VSLRLKILLIVLPILIVSMVLAGTSSYFTATNGISRVTTELLSFKAAELEKYVQSQWSLLVENGFTQRPDMVSATQAGILTFAQSLQRSSTEVILALDESADIVLKTANISLLPGEAKLLLDRGNSRSADLAVVIGGVDRVARGFPFAPFHWVFLVTEEKKSFYSDVDRISRETALILAASVILAVILLLVFIRFISKPLEGLVKAMRSIISSGDLTQKVAVEYPDEIGHVSHTFNLMIVELDRAYSQIKKFAFEAVLAQKKEMRIRHIFQKYVPQELIDRFFQNPESMLVGENRNLSILFSDIRSFTTISESMAPDDLVNSLNRYFNVMVDIIMDRQGIIDKYIGDAIMAFFGAPVKHDDDALNSLVSAFEMIEALHEFNAQQEVLGKPPFKIGIGINYGPVTVGNIGSEKKMDYTVIGDSVNLASRLEGLTKPYHAEIVFAEFLWEEVKDTYPCRLLDAVAVKGKTKGVRIFTAKPKLTEAEAKAWSYHNEGMELYFNRRFNEASGCFKSVLEYLPDDWSAGTLLARCLEYQKDPPPSDWDGVEVMKTK
jgi:class 3 adenylate cyclase/HAMP domain-containing protein